MKEKIIFGRILLSWFLIFSGAIGLLFDLFYFQSFLCLVVALVIRPHRYFIDRCEEPDSRRMLVHFLISYGAPLIGAFLLLAMKDSVWALIFGIAAIVFLRYVILDFRFITEYSRKETSRHFSASTDVPGDLSKP
jgi:hypothetical protein